MNDTFTTTLPATNVPVANDSNSNSNSMAGEITTNINIKIKTIQDAVYSFDVVPDILVGQLKTIVKESTEIPEQCQRLIYKGKLMKDTHTLFSYRVEDGHTLHLVTRRSEALAEEPEISGPAEDHQEDEQPSEPESSTPCPLTRIQQGLLTLETILSTTAIRRHSTSSYQFTPGQWLDAQDTVHQWLEATVLDVDATQVFIHYNGWPNHWDEWMDCNSPRLAPFRTFTRPTSISSAAPFLSPSITINPDHEEEEEELRQLVPCPGLRGLLPQLRDLTQSITSSLDHLIHLSEEQEEKEETPGAPPSFCSSVRNTLTEIPETWEDLEDHDISTIVIDDDDDDDESTREPVSPSFMPSLNQAPTLASRDSLNTIDRRRIIQETLDLAPLFDRLGRVLVDTAIPLRQMAMNEVESLSSAVGSRGEQNQDNRSEVREIEAEALEQGNSPALESSSRPFHETGGDSPYRQLLPIMNYGEGNHGGRRQANIDIHIHAIIAPSSSLLSREMNPTNDDMAENNPNDEDENEDDPAIRNLENNVNLVRDMSQHVERLQRHLAQGEERRSRDMTRMRMRLNDLTRNHGENNEHHTIIEENQDTLHQAIADSSPHLLSSFQRRQRRRRRRDRLIPTIADQSTVRMNEDVDSPIDPEESTNNVTEEDEGGMFRFRFSNLFSAVQRIIRSFTSSRHDVNHSSVALIQDAEEEEEEGESILSESEASENSSSTLDRMIDRDDIDDDGIW